MKENIKEIASLGWGKLKNIAIIIKNILIKKRFYIPILILVAGLIAYFLFKLIFDFFLFDPIVETYRLKFLKIITEKEYFERIIEIKFKFATILGGIGGLILLGVQIYRTITFAKQVKEEKRSNIYTNTLDQYVKAVDQLKDKSIAVRLGGIYSLEKIMNSKDKEVQGYHDTIIELFCAYIREKCPFDIDKYWDLTKKIDKLEKKDKKIADKNNNEYDDLNAEIEKFHIKVKTDIQAILTVLGRRENIDNEHVRIDLNNSNLYKYNLYEANFKNALLYESNLENAILTRVNFENANLIKTNLNFAILAGANLRYADLRNANLRYADLGIPNLINPDLNIQI